MCMCMYMHTYMDMVLDMDMDKVPVSCIQCCSLLRLHSLKLGLPSRHIGLAVRHGSSKSCTVWRLTSNRSSWIFGDPLSCLEFLIQGLVVQQDGQTLLPCGQLLSHCSMWRNIAEYRGHPWQTICTWRNAKAAEMWKLKQSSTTRLEC